MLPEKKSVANSIVDEVKLFCWLDHYYAPFSYSFAKTSIWADSKR